MPPRWMVVAGSWSATSSSCACTAPTAVRAYCQRFAMADLANPDGLDAFLFLLSRATLFGADPAAESPVERLAKQTHVEEERITKAFYVFYRDLRLNLFHQLRRDNPPARVDQAAAHQDRLLALAQKLLDRCLFICFCEDTGLLPAKVISYKVFTKSTGLIRISHLGKSGFLSNFFSIARIAFLVSEIPFS